MAKICEICGKKLKGDEYKMFSPKGALDMIYVCETCYYYGRESENGSVKAVEYFTKDIEVTKASEKGRKCINQCLNNAKIEIEKKLNPEKYLEEDKPSEYMKYLRPKNEDEEIAMNKVFVTPVDTLMGYDSIDYCPLMVVSFGITRESGGIPAERIVNETEKMKLHAYKQYGADAIIGLRVNQSIDAVGTILITIYATPVIINDLHED